MANWCNARLIVSGRRGDVLSFSRLSQTRPSSLFGADMLRGETDDLRSERIKTLERGLAKKVYNFQIRNDDGRDYFRRLSRQFPALIFVLVYFDPNNDPSGSYFIWRGQARSYELPGQLQEAVMEKHGITNDVFAGEWSSEDEWRYQEASWELMGLAEAYWQQTLHRTICRQLSSH